MPKAPRKPTRRVPRGTKSKRPRTPGPLIKTAPDFDSDAGLSRYLLKYQIEGVTCPARFQFTEKANRIGWTWLDALRNVRRRIMEPGRDYLFTTQNWNGALEYGRYLDEWISIFNLGRFGIHKTEEVQNFTRMLDDGSTVAVQEKVGVYTFDGGSRIILFSSSPWGLQTFQGDVGWDEAAFHDRQKDMWAAISTRLQWGFDVSVWSAHNGVSSWFNQVLGKTAKAPDSGWKCRKITIHDAIADGLVEKINQKSGQKLTREQFLKDCRTRAATAEIFAERFECNPSDAGSNIVPWAVIEKASTRDIVRDHLDNEKVHALFGFATDCPTKAQIDARKAKIRRYLRDTFAPLLAKPAHYRLGFDVAASGLGDLGSFWLSTKEGGKLKQAALLTTRTEDWHFIGEALAFFMEDLPAIKGCGDGTGLGREITWKASAKYSGRFDGVRFSRESKSEMGSRLMLQLSSGEFEISNKGFQGVNSDIGMDIFSLQKTTANNNLVFTATQNPLNAASHCDMAWSAALCAHADATLEGSGEAFSVSNVRHKGGTVLSSVPLARRFFGGPRPRRLP